MGVIVYSPIEQGLLSGKVSEDRRFERGDLRAGRPLFQMESRRRINAAVRDTLAPIAEAHGATPVQAAIAWTFHQPGVTAAIVGARNPGQVEENAAAGALELTTEELDTLARVFSELDVTRA